MEHIPTRKTIRLKNWNYAKPGYYFITICTKDKACLLWEIVGTPPGRPPLSAAGEMINREIQITNNIYQYVKIDKYVIMPNHVHLIICLNGCPGGIPTISKIVNQLKGSVSKQIGFKLWQPRFHDRIIRNESEYQKIWQYIENNPMTWEHDCYFTK